MHITGMRIGIDILKLNLGCCVLDYVAFIEDDVVPGDGRKQRGVGAKRVVRRHNQRRRRELRRGDSG